MNFYKMKSVQGIPPIKKTGEVQKLRKEKQQQNKEQSKDNDSLSKYEIFRQGMAKNSIKSEDKVPSEDKKQIVKTSQDIQYDSTARMLMERRIKPMEREL